MTKSQVRTHMKNKMSVINTNDLPLCKLIKDLNIISQDLNIAYFLALKYEVSPKFIYNMYGKSNNFYLPCIENNNLIFRLQNNDTVYKLNKFNILEPTENSKSISIHKLDLVIIPLLAFNYQGFRLGHGGGFYDRAFKNFHNPKIAISCKNQYNSDWIPESHDIKLDLVITHEKVFNF